jgi:Cas7 group CRISPR-associated protein Csh2
MALVKKVYGALIIQATKSNPNGDPDNDGSPRVDVNDRGVISPVSTKRRIRDLVARRSEAWHYVASDLNISGTEAEESFQIYVLKSRSPREILEQSADMDAFHRRYWDARVFGNTLLESNSTRRTNKDRIRTGVIAVGSGQSLAPVEVATQTWTRAAGIQEGKESGFGNECHKYVEHGIYVQPFSVNPERANETGVTPRDVDVFIRLLPHIFDARSVASAGVEVLQVWTLQFDGRSTLPMQLFLDAVSPRVNVDHPKGFKDYEFSFQIESDLFKGATVKEWCGWR